MARGLCTNAKVLHEEKVRLGNTGQILRGVFVGMVLDADLYGFSPQPQIRPERLSVCYPTHRGAVCDCQSSPSLHTGQSPRVTTLGPVHTGTVSVRSSCRTLALRKQAAQPGLEMGLASQ